MEDGYQYFSFAWNYNWFVIVNENRSEIIKRFANLLGVPFFSSQNAENALIAPLLKQQTSVSAFLHNFAKQFALWGFLEKVMFCSHLECASAANRVNVLYIVVKVKHKKRRLGVMPWKGEIPQTLYIVDSISTYTKSFISWHLEILKIYTLIYCFHAYIFSFVLYLWGPVLRIRYFLSTNIVKDMCSLPQTLAKIRFINRNSDIELWPNKTHCV